MSKTEWADNKLQGKIRTFVLQRSTNEERGAIDQDERPGGLSKPPFLVPAVYTRIQTRED